MANIFEYTFTADGNSPEITLNEGRIPLFYDFFGSGNGLGGGTLKAQYKPYGSSTWKDIADTSITDLTASGVQLAFVPQNSFRFNLSGSTSPNVTARLDEIVTV